MCASTGNTSAAAAAYAARGNLNCIVLIPNNNIALGKLAQAIIYGAKVIAIEGNFDRALEIVREITAKHPITLVNSVNPYRIEGQKTAAFEVVDQLGKAPDYLAIPVGNAGNITAYWKGFKEYYAKGKSTTLPKMIGFEAEGSAAIVRGEPILNPETVATAIRIGNPASWDSAVRAANESNGQINFVSDEEILHAYRTIAAKEGVFAEPASAASIAGVMKLKKEGYFSGGESVVCVLTGHGLKDPNIAIKSVTSGDPLVVKDSEEAVMEAIRQLEG
jgi:threonine synthase